MQRNVEDQAHLPSPLDSNVERGEHDLQRLGGRIGLRALEPLQAGHLELLQVHGGKQELQAAANRASGTLEP